MDIRPDHLAKSEDLPHFQRIVRAAFGQRRKTLLNAFRSAGISNDSLQQVQQDTGISLSRRAETLSIQEFRSITKCFQQGCPEILKGPPSGNLSANVREYGRPLSPVEAGADRPVSGGVHSVARPTAPTVGPVFVVLGAIQFTPVPGIRQHSPPLAPPAVLVTPDSAAPAPDCSVHVAGAAWPCLQNTGNREAARAQRHGGSSGSLPYCA